MSAQFTEKANTALRYAQRASGKLQVGYVGTEHILLGLMREETGVAAHILSDNGVKEEKIEELIEELIAIEKPVLKKLSFSMIKNQRRFPHSMRQSIIKIY